ncbi:hypothetical protein KEM56_005343 [Ascosphaera pollenicola]|nr:hypothetical protein KEM56_005343 [Ascosphaera pollenicola]
MGEPFSNRACLNAGAEVHNRVIRVWVTGFGLFRGNQTNPSYSIAKILPDTITLDDLKYTVHIHCHPEPLRVAYDTVHSITRDGIKQFREDHDGHAPDLILHMGMAKGRNFYCVETLARREGYQIGDVDGKKAIDYEHLFRTKGYPEVLRPGDPPSVGVDPGPETGSREGLTPSRPDERLLKTWKSFARENEDVRLSTDAGRYLCEFIFYNSLSHAWEEGRNLSVLFLHVPGWDAPEDIERGKEATVALLKSTITCWSAWSAPYP